MPQLSKLQSLLASLFFPAFCHNCQKWLSPGEGSFFCPSCWDKIPLLENWCSSCGMPLYTQGIDPMCGECRKSAPPFRSARAVGLYDGVLRQAIHVFKYSGKISLGRQLGQLMVEHCPTYWPAWDYDFIAPVPLHPRRLREREFNQSYVLAHHLGEAFKTPLLSDCLQRSDFKRAQVGLTGQERLSNIKNCFSLKRPELVYGKKLLLIDDVYTTGATIKECSRVLMAASSQAVDVYTLGRA